jgi:hypothetical protein
MMTFKHNGKIGDILYSLPIIKAMGGGVLWIPEATHEAPCIFSNMYSLLKQQPYLVDVKQYPSFLAYGELCKSISINIDLDRHREHEKRGWQNMVLRYADVFNIPINHKDPWLTVEGPRLIEHEYNLISLTPRHRSNSRVNWKRVYLKIDKPAYFIGTVEEHNDFVHNIAPIERLCTTDLLTFALYIKHCTALFCNQSASLVIAQGLGKTYYCDFKPRKENCKFFTPNEYQLI